MSYEEEDTCKMDERVQVCRHACRQCFTQLTQRLSSILRVSSSSYDMYPPPNVLLKQFTQWVSSILAQVFGDWAAKGEAYAMYPPPNV
jgi:hypothetical protein